MEELSQGVVVLVKEGVGQCYRMIVGENCRNCLLAGAAIGDQRCHLKMLSSHGLQEWLFRSEMLARRLKSPMVAWSVSRRSGIRSILIVLFILSSHFSCIWLERSLHNNASNNQEWWPLGQHPSFYDIDFLNCSILFHFLNLVH